jgi:hypothetical protein
MKTELPLSAMIIPYCCKAVRITFDCGGNPEVSKLDFRRKRMPMTARHKDWPSSLPSDLRAE